VTVVTAPRGTPQAVSDRGALAKNAEAAELAAEAAREDARKYQDRDYFRASVELREHAAKEAADALQSARDECADQLSAIKSAHDYEIGVWIETTLPEFLDRVQTLMSSKNQYRDAQRRARNLEIDAGGPLRSPVAEARTDFALRQLQLLAFACGVTFDPSA
jgi:hypothetical protein